MPKNLKKPKAIKTNSKVGLVAPSFGFDINKFEDAKKFLSENYSLKFEQQEDVFDRDGYFSGTDERRLNELFNFLSNPEIEAVFGIRGGYGCTRIYPDLIKKLKKIKNLKPKIVLGYSDITILLNGLYQDLGWTTFHGPVMVSKPMVSPNEIEKYTFDTALFSNKKIGTVQHEDMKTIQAGTAQGVLVGGCLSMVIAALGTPYEVQTKNKILFLEDVGERPYRIDRMITQLIHSGSLSSVKAIIFGEFTQCEPPPETQDVLTAITGALKPFLSKHKIPVIYNFPAGHGSPQITFPLGVQVKVQAQKNKTPKVIFQESGCL